MLGMFTFSDGGEPLGYTGLAAEGIKIAEKFKFNNSAMFTKKKDTLSLDFFRLGEQNFSKFFDYIVEENKLPISLNATKEVLNQRK